MTESEKASLGSDYSFVIFDENKYLAYTQVKSDSLPITSFYVGPKPCLDSTLSPVESKNNLYPLEFDAITDYCEEKDERYSALGDDFSITLDELQDQNDILSTME